LYCNRARSNKTARNADVRVSVCSRIAQTVIIKYNRVSRRSQPISMSTYLIQPPTNHPPTISTYLIFNQLRIIHPQFRPKSRASVLGPPRNILSNAFSYLELTIVIEYFIVVVRARSKEEAVQQKPSRIALSHILILLCGHSKCSYFFSGGTQGSGPWVWAFLRFY
ncbi:neurotrimin-like isoform X2, partial [Vespula squamosa]